MGWAFVIALAAAQDVTDAYDDVAAEQVDRGDPIRVQQAAPISLPRDELLARMAAWLDVGGSLSGFHLVDSYHTAETDTIIVGVRTTFEPRGARAFWGSINTIVWVELRDGRFRLTVAPMRHLGTTKNMDVLGSSEDPGAGVCRPMPCPADARRRRAWHAAQLRATSFKAWIADEVIEALTTPLVPGPTGW